MSDRGRSSTDEDRSGFVFEGTRTESGDEADSRSDPSRRESGAGSSADFLAEDDRTGTAVTVVVVFGLLLATASIGYAVTAAEEGSGGPGGDPTGFSLLTETENGTLVARDYPTNFTYNESESVVVAVSNGGDERTNYTVVVELQRIRPGGDGADGRVLEERELRRFRMSVPANETRYTTYNATPTMSGENLRLVFLLYRSGVPADPTTANAYRELHLTVNVTAPPSSRTRSGSLAVGVV